MRGCGTLADLKAVLEDTDYSPFIQSDTDISIPILKQKLKLKLADEFEFLIANSTSPLSEFIYMMQSRYMIDNLVNMIEGIKNKVDTDILL